MSKSTEEGQGVLEPGTVVNQRYRVEKRLGAGGMGNVYLAEDLNFPDQRVALKVLHKELLNDDKQRQRFLRETQLMRRINQQNVVRVFDVGTEGDVSFFTMEYVPGRQLEDFVQAHSFPLDKIPTLIIQICEGLEAVHKAGVIHRDLKPANIIVLKDGSAKITDFGVARPEYSNLTAHNEIVGSALYIAPEVWIGTRMTHSIDLYSLGVILFELTTGILPFEGDSPAALMRLHMDQPPSDPKSLNSDIPTWLNKLILRLLEKSEADRPRDAREVIEYVKLHTQRASGSIDEPGGATSGIRTYEAEQNYIPNDVVRETDVVDGAGFREVATSGKHLNRRSIENRTIIAGGASLARRLALSAVVLLLFGLLPTILLRLISEIKPMVLASTPSGLSYLLLQGMELPGLPVVLLWVGAMLVITLLFSILPGALIGAASGSPQSVLRATIRSGIGALLLWCALMVRDLEIYSHLGTAASISPLSVYSSSLLVREQLLQLAYLDPVITVIKHTAVEHGQFAEDVGGASIYSSLLLLLGYLFFAVQIAGITFRALGNRVSVFCAVISVAAVLSLVGVISGLGLGQIGADTALNSPILVFVVWIVAYLAVLGLSMSVRWSNTSARDL